MTRDQAVRYVGARPASLVPVTFLLSVLFTALFFMVEQAINGWGNAALYGLIFGAVMGVFGVGFIMGLLVLRVRAKHAMLWCFGGTVFAATLGLGLFGSDYIAISGAFGFFLAVVLLLCFGPRYTVYRYGRGPGCKYDLTLLPKSDVCPECGRDNRDLVEMFADVEFRESSAST